jgi:uncharacterized membrane protein YhaH (DUF805 family)
MRHLLAPYFALKGRSTRREWWIIEICVVFGFKLNWALYEATSLDGSPFDLGEKSNQTWILFALTLLWLNVASNVRRLHDRGKSGWWSLFFFIPGFGQMWCFIECGFLKGQPFANKYGPVPGGNIGGGQKNELFTALSGAAPKVAAFEQRATLAGIRDQIAAIIKAGPEQHTVGKPAAPTKPTARASVLPNTTASSARAEPRRRSVLASQSAGTVTRVDHRRYNMTAAFVIGIALLLGAGAVFLASVDFSSLTPLLDPDAYSGTFSSSDRQFVPLRDADD